MKKSILQFSVIAAIAASMTLTTSCSSDDSAEVYVPEPLQFNVGVGELKASTRATAETAPAVWTTVDEIFGSGDYIGIYTTDADGKWYKKCYTTASASASPNAATTLTTVSGAADKFYWASQTDAKSFHAWSYGNDVATEFTNTLPNSGDGTNSLTFPKFTVPTNQQTAAKNIEFLYSYGYIPYSTDAKTIVLNHQLARIDLVLVTDKGDANLVNTKHVYIGKEETGKGVTIAGTLSKGTDITSGSRDLGAGHNGTWSLSDAEGDVDKQITPRVTVAETAADGKYTTKYSAVVIPQSFENKPMFVVSYDGATYVYTGGEDDDLEIGKKYTYKITISAQDIKVTQVSINAWGEVAGYTTLSPYDANATLE